MFFFHLLTVLLVYPDQIAKLSWFPLDNIWNNTGLNVGHWNEECEAWYAGQRHKILNGQAQPQVSKKWRNSLRMTRAASTIYHHTKLAALDYVRSSFASPILYDEVRIRLRFSGPQVFLFLILFYILLTMFFRYLMHLQ